MVEPVFSVTIQLLFCAEFVISPFVTSSVPQFIIALFLVDVIFPPVITVFALCLLYIAEEYSAKSSIVPPTTFNIFELYITVFWLLVIFPLPIVNVPSFAIFPSKMYSPFLRLY